jgi:hypothetical protein
MIFDDLQSDFTYAGFTTSLKTPATLTTSWAPLVTLSRAVQFQASLPECTFVQSGLVRGFPPSIPVESDSLSYARPSRK